MYLKVLACDLDGTLAEAGQIAPATWDSLRQARAAGLTLVLVTGRRLETFAAEGPFAELFEAIVAENGAAVYFPRRDSVILPFGQLERPLLERLAALGIPLERGTAIVATRVPHDAAVLATLREMGGGASVEYNKGAVMVLPPGATKGTGLQRALHELGYSLRNAVACGDAENDRSLFEMSEFAVAVANATPEVQALADLVLAQGDGAGVRSLLSLLTSARAVPAGHRRRRALRLGTRADGSEADLDARQLLSRNLGIVGSSASGKSWLAGLLTEEVLRLGYQACIIDPEGDYRGLRAFPHTLLLGGPGTQLPAVSDLVTLSEYTDVSLVLDLSGSAPEERRSYAEALLRGLFALRVRRGRPHWFLIDEVHGFCPSNDAPCELFPSGMAEGGVAAVSYRPSWIAPALTQAFDLWLLLRTTQPDDLALLERLVGTAELGLEPGSVSSLPLGEAYLLCRDPACGPGAERIRFRADRRVVPHVRHLHKYLRAPLPSTKRFYFRSGPPCCAASFWEFREALQTVPLGALRYHLGRGDFERWVAEVLHDQELARRIHKLANRPLEDAELREALRGAVALRYEELESLI